MNNKELLLDRQMDYSILVMSVVYIFTKRKYWFW